MALLALSAEKEQWPPFPTIFGKLEVNRVASKASSEEANMLEELLKDGVGIAEVCRTDD